MTKLPIPKDDKKFDDRLDEYFDWNTENMPPPLDALNGLRNIMLFIQDHLLDKIPLRDGLRDRLFNELNEIRPLIPEKTKNEPHVKYALEYVFNTTQEKWGMLDHDPKYWFMISYASVAMFDRYKEFGRIFSVMKHGIDAYFDSKSLVFINEIGSPEFIEAANKEDGRDSANLPLETLFCLGQIDFYYYTRQQLAFDHGLDLVQAIDGYLIAPHAQGSILSLLPENGRARVPVSELRWPYLPIGEQYRTSAMSGKISDLDKVWDRFAAL